MNSISKKVKDFYAELPFNYTQSIARTATDIRKYNSVLAYPPLADLITGSNPRVLDVGCGPGWLALTVAEHYKASVTGIDYNPVAIARASEIANLLKSDAQFRSTDLFDYRPEKRFDIVTSIGALHHTEDCLRAIKHIAEQCVADHGYIFLGLYHLYGRRPFIKHFERLKQECSDRSQLLAEYQRLDPRFSDDQVQLESWYRDQVEHPHETQHTLSELLPIFESIGFTVLGTSLHNICKTSDIKTIENKENQYEKFAEKLLAEGKYCPGFFTVWAKKNQAPNKI
jgi:SAM-dependent methyltransferase